MHKQNNRVTFGRAFRGRQGKDKRETLREKKRRANSFIKLSLKRFFFIS